MSSQRANRTSLGLLSATAGGIGWALCILLHGVETYALGMDGGPWLFELLDAHDAGAVLAALATLALVNAVLIGGIVETWTRYEPPATWLRLACVALAGIPLLGLYVIPFGRWLAEAKPAWALIKADPGRPMNGRPFLFLPGWYLRASQIFLFALLVVNAVAIQASLACVLDPGWSAGFRSQALLAARIGLRITGFCASLIPVLLLYRCERISRRAFLLAFLCCFAWLAPWPFYAIGMVAAFLGFEKKKKQQLLSTIAYAGRARISQRLEKGGGMDWWKASLWQRWRFDWLAARAPTTEAQLIRLYRVKTFLLILEAGAFMLALGRLAQDGSMLEAAMAWAARRASSLSLPVPDAAVLLLPVLLLLVARSAEALQTPRASAPLLPWRYLLLALGAVLIGTQQGLLLAGDPLGLAVSLLYVGFAGGTSIFVLSMPFHLKSAPRPDTLSSIAPWIALFLSMEAAGRILIEDENLAPGVLRVLELCALLSPVWALAAGLAWGRSLIEPFQPRDLLSRRFAAGPRAMLAFLILAAALPFGGLATPLWRPLRSRLLRVSLDAGRA